jgi:hypothetical protein
MRAGLKPLGEMIAAATLVALAALAAPAQAQTTSVEQANAALAKVATERAAVNDEFAESEAVCNSKFFVNNCLDKAKEKRRIALSSLRAIEVEAEHFKRVDSVRKRDADLAERARKDAEDQALRTTHAPKQPKDQDKPPQRSSGPSVAEREAGHEAKMQRQAAQDAAEAGKRAANVQAFEQKKAESERRQADVARKKLENAAKAAKKEASDKKQAEADAAAAKAAAAKAASK